MSEVNEVVDFDSNLILETKTDELKESNSKENYILEDNLQAILIELKKITKELKKINQ